LTSDESAAGARWISFDRVEIDLTGRRLFVAGRESPLEPKAFAVLALLARQPGRAFTRDEILDAVWEHRHVTPGVLNRIVTLLRHALGESADRTQYLHTLYGVGYRFDAAVRFSAQRATAEPIDGAPGPQTTSPAAPGNVDAAEPANTVARDPVTSSHPSSPQSISGQLPPSRLSHAILLLPPLLVALVLAAWLLWLRAPSPDAAPTSVKEQGIAVLPLVNAGGDMSQQFFADGISENLINTLSQLEGLRVIGRGSSFRFRDSQEGGKAAAAKLGVAHLIEGSVQRIADDVRVGIELVRATDGSTVWTQRFDRPYKDLFALQDEIALAVAGALQVKLLHSMPGAVETGRPASGNLEAYNAYLQGAYYMSGGQNIRKAIEQFEQATRLDPDYAQAWSWLGFQRTQFARGNLEGDAARAAYTQARQEIDTALRLQADFGQAHAIRANLLGTADHDWNGALAEFRIALSLVTDTDPTHGAVSRLLATLGRVNEAIAERHKYIAGDPLSGFARVYLADLLASLGRLDEAEASLREAMERQPDEAEWHASERSYLAVLRGDAAAAQSEAESLPASRWRTRALALALQVGTDRPAADAALQSLVETDAQRIGGAYSIARVHALRGDANQAFEWLQRDWDRSGTGMHYALFDPLLLRFRDDPRFAAYCRQAGLPAPSASEALGIDQIRAKVVARH
jgi:TolB-like protein/DNA-binding winged helix-turn-helix (wHTH) protein/Tfp pilus assembly protein PilF